MKESLYKIKVKSVDYSITEEDVDDGKLDEQSIQARIFDIKSHLPQEMILQVVAEEDCLDDVVCDEITNKTKWLINSFEYEVVSKIDNWKDFHFSKFSYPLFETYPIDKLNGPQIKRTYEDYLYLIKKIDIICFVVSLIKIRFNKDGTLPKNLKKAFYIDGALPKKCADSTKSFELFTPLGNILVWFSIVSTKLVVNIVAYFDNYKLINSPRIPLYQDIKCQEDFDITCNEYINELRNSQFKYIKTFQTLKNVVEELEQFDFRGISTWDIRNWLS